MSDEPPGDDWADEPTLPGIEVEAAPSDPPPPPAGPPHRVPSAWPIWAWLMVGVAVLVTAVGVVSGILARSVLLDILSFWPVFVVTFLAAAASFPRMRRGAPRVAAVIPLLLLTWLGLAVALHLIGWPQLPSAAADLAGPPVGGIEQATLSFEIPGSATVGAGGAALYEVALMRRGGATRAPEAFEVDRPNGFAVDVDERPDSGWYQSEGWDVLLAPSVAWVINLHADRIDADLRALALAGGSITADGVIRLGGLPAGARLTVSGDLRMEVDAASAIRIEGDASVPGTWPAADGGWRSPVDGEPYVISVTDGAAVTIVVRP